MGRQRSGFERCARAEKAAAGQRRSGTALATTWFTTRSSSISPSEAGEAASTEFSTRAEASQGVRGEGIERFFSGTRAVGRLQKLVRGIFPRSFSALALCEGDEDGIG